MSQKLHLITKVPGEPSHGLYTPSWVNGRGRAERIKGKHRALWMRLLDGWEIGWHHVRPIQRAVESYDKRHRRLYAFDMGAGLRWFLESQVVEQVRYGANVTADLVPGGPDDAESWDDLIGETDQLVANLWALSFTANHPSLPAPWRKVLNGRIDETLTWGLGQLRLVLKANDTFGYSD